MKIKKEDCPRSIDLVTATEDFSEKSGATVSCTRCGAQAHDPSLLCSPEVTLASSTPLRESSQSSFSSQGQSQQSGFQSSQGSSQGYKGSQSGFQGGLGSQGEKEDIVE